MKQIKKIIMLLLLVFSGFSAEFEYESALDNIIDNREMQSSYLKSQTILLSSLNLEAGMKFNNVNRIRFGLNYYKDFGAKKDWNNFSPLLYFQFKRGGDDLCFGIFSRNKLRKYPVSLINDSLNVYRSYMEGLLYEKSGQIFKQNLWLDWISMITSKSPEDREAFLTGFSGEFTFNAFYFDYYFLYHHIAHSDNHPKDEHVEHHGGLTVTLGKGFKNFGFIDSLDISVDGLLTYNKEMFVDNSWQAPFGMTFQSYFLLTPKWAFNIKYYKGIKKDKKMWHNIPTGDQVYQADDFGLLELLFLPFNNEFISSELKISLWFVDGIIDSRQMFNINAHFKGFRELKHR